MTCVIKDDNKEPGGLVILTLFVLRISSSSGLGNGNILFTKATCFFILVMEALLNPAFLLESVVVDIRDSINALALAGTGNGSLGAPGRGIGEVFLVVDFLLLGAWLTSTGSRGRFKPFLLFRVDDDDEIASGMANAHAVTSTLGLTKAIKSDVETSVIFSKRIKIEIQQHWSNANNHDGNRPIGSIVHSLTGIRCRHLVWGVHLRMVALMDG